MSVLTSIYFNYTDNASVICDFMALQSDTSDTVLDTSGQLNSHRTQHIWKTPPLCPKKLIHKLRLKNLIFVRETQFMIATIHLKQKVYSCGAGLLCYQKC